MSGAHAIGILACVRARAPYLDCLSSKVVSQKTYCVIVFIFVTMGGDFVQWSRSACSWPRHLSSRFHPKHRAA
eukprot:5465688-Amphidinium_carterae.1